MQSVHAHAEPPAQRWTQGLGQQNESTVCRRSKVGTNDGNNLQAADPACNLRTGNRTGSIADQGSTEQAKSRATEEQQLIPPGNRPALTRSAW